MKRKIIQTRDDNSYYGFKDVYEDGQEIIFCDECGKDFTDKGIRIHFGKMHKLQTIKEAK